MRKNCGFTLIELVVSFIVVGILYTATLFMWPSDSISVDSQLRQLVSDTNYIRILALTNHASYQINFSSSGYTTTETDGSTAVMLPTHNSNSVTMTTGISATYSNATLIFDHLGIPYTSLGNALNTTATITLTGSDGSSYTMSVSPETGYISIS